MAAQPAPTAATARKLVAHIFVCLLQAGGFVADGRVNGSLNLSRALGDLEYKQTKELGPEEQVRRQQRVCVVERGRARWRPGGTR